MSYMSNQPGWPEQTYLSSSSSSSPTSATCTLYTLSSTTCASIRDVEHHTHTPTRLGIGPPKAAALERCQAPKPPDPCITEAQGWSSANPVLGVQGNGAWEVTRGFVGCLTLIIPPNLWKEPCRVSLDEVLIQAGPRQQLGGSYLTASYGQVHPSQWPLFD